MSMQNDKVAAVLDVIGPLPDGSGLIVVSSDGKTFPIPARFGEAEACYALSKGDVSSTPFDFMVAVFGALNVKVSKVKILKANFELYAVLYMSYPLGKMLRVATDRAASGVVAALCSGAPLFIEEDALDGIVNSANAYSELQSEFGRLWPMAPITNSRTLQIMSDYMDAAMPNGSPIVK